MIFGTSSAPKNPPAALNWKEDTTTKKMSWTSNTSEREPDVVSSFTSGSKNYLGDEVKNNYINAGIKDKQGNIIADAGEFKTQLEDEFKDMIDSIIKYKGFYIGRYETGNLHYTNQLNRARVVKNNMNTSGISDGANADQEAIWYAMYQKNKEIVQGRTGLIWGCQWDACMNGF